MRLYDNFSASSLKLTMLNLWFCLALALPVCYANTGDVTDPKELLASLEARAKLLEQSVRTEEVLGERLQKEVAEQGSLASACHKKLRAAEELVKSIDNPTGCKVPKSIRNCQEWYNGGYSTDGDYTVDPDGLGGVKAFTVECQFSNPYDPKDKRVFTNLHHNAEKRYDVDKCKDPLCFQKNFTYSISKDQIVALMKSSASCEQELVYDCYGAKLLKGGFGAWYSRDNVKQDYWAGSSSGSGTCGCAKAGNCFKKSKTCSCDVGDFSWQLDRGMLKDISTLPVTKVALGDTAGKDQSAYIRVGPLRCTGSSK